MTIDKQKLKALAEAATPGRHYDRLESAGGGIKYECAGDDGSLVLKVDHKNNEFGFVGDRGEADEAFFLACSPAAVLALLAEIERLESAKGDPVGSFDKHMEYMQENIRLKAENEDYRSGQDRYEQIIDDLKAESEALRKALGNLLSLYEEDEGCRSLPQYTAGVAAMTKEASHG